MEDRISLIYDGFPRDSGVTDQAFLYVMHDFALRHDQKVIVSFDNAVIMSGNEDVHEALKAEFKGTQFFSKVHNPLYIERVIQQKKEDAEKEPVTNEKEPPPEPLYS